MRLSIFLTVFVMTACSRKNSTVNQGSGSFSLQLISVNGKVIPPFNGISIQPIIAIKFSAPVNKSSATGKIRLLTLSGTDQPIRIDFSTNDSTVTVSPQSPLNYLTRYKIRLDASLTSASGAMLNSPGETVFYTSLDSSDKFPQVSDTALVQLTQQQTFKYFWDFAHPVSGLARERNTSGETVTSGGSGFGIMAIISGINRGFITRPQGLARMQTIVSFLKNTAQKFKGAFPHWLNGATGAVIPFSTNDNGADLVETSFLVMGLLTARQYFSGSDAAETSLRNDINTIWNNVDWNFFRQGKKFCTGTGVLTKDLL